MVTRNNRSGRVGRKSYNVTSKGVLYPNKIYKEKISLRNQIRKNEDLAIKSYEKNKITDGDRYDKKADKLYKKYYNKYIEN